MSKLTKRITAMLLSGMIIFGSAPGSALAASTDADSAQTSEIVEEVYEEESSELPMSDGEMAESEDASEAPVSVGETSETSETSETPADVEESLSEEAQYYTVTLDANGGYFENEWDDVIGDYAQQAEVVEKHIPVGGTVAVVPVFTDPDGQTMLFAGWSLERDGELITVGGEEYAPVDNCVLYAVWQAEDVVLGETGDQEVSDENSEQVDSEKESDNIQHSMEAGGERISNIAIDRQYNENEQIEDPKVIESEDGIEEVTSEQNMNDGDDDDPQALYPQVAFEEEEILAVAGYNKYLEYSASNIEGEYLDYDLIWESSRTDIALISSDGYLRPLRAGETIVSLSVEGTDIVASCKVTVVDPERESEYHLTKKDFEDVQEVEPGLIVGGLRKNTYGNVCLLPGKYIINEDIRFADVGKFYFEDGGQYTFSGEGSFYDSLIGKDESGWYTDTAFYIFEDFKLDNVNISCYGIRIIGGTYKDLFLDIQDDGIMEDSGIYSGYFDGFTLVNDNDSTYGDEDDQRFTIKGGEFLNGSISGDGWWCTKIIDGSFKDVCVCESCEIYGGTFVTQKDDYAIRAVGCGVQVYGGYFKGNIAAAMTDSNDLYIRGGTFENGQVGAIIMSTGLNTHQEAGKTIKEYLDPYECKNTEYFEIVMDGRYYDVAKGIDGAVDIGYNIEKYDVRVTDAVYTGQNIIPEYRIFYPENMYYPNLTLGTDYELKVENNLDVGTGKLTITGKGEFFGTITSTFKIKPAPISNAIVTGLSDKTYNGVVHTQSPIVKMGSTTLKENSDYNVSYSNNINAGRATITIAGKGRYTGSKNISFMIKKAAQSITASNLSLTFPNSGKITASGNKGSLSYKSSNTAVATVDSAGKVTAKGAGKATITITAAATSNYNAATKTITVTVAKTAQSITAKAAASSVAVGKTTTVSITGAKGTKSFKSSDTTVAAVTSAGKVTAKKVGTVKITATSAATSNYNATSKTVTIKVVPAATASLAAENQAAGIKLTWKKVTGANGYKVYRGTTLIKTITSGSTVTFADAKANTNGTKYTYKVVAKASTGDSTLSKSVAVYRVTRPAISSATNSASKKMTVKWGKNAKANGYQIQYSTDKTFKSGNKAVTVTGASTVSKVIGSLTKGKTYYVRIRTYKTVGSAKYWSVWSAAKSVKISK